MRTRWTELSKELLTTPVPVDRIVGLDRERSLPQWPHSVPFDSGAPALFHAAVHPQRADPGDWVHVEWEARGSDWVELAGRRKRRPIAGRVELSLPLTPGPSKVHLQSVATPTMASA